METLKLSTLTKANLQRVVTLTECGIEDYAWSTPDEVDLSESEQMQLQTLNQHLRNVPVHLMNEATIWSRAIYPLLLLAEQPKIQVWAEVPLSADYNQFRLEGIVDGVMGRCVAETIEAPYLVVVEAKRGLEGQNPLAQLYGQLLAAARLNWQNNQQPTQEIYGCYTIADVWTFVRGQVANIENDSPHLRVESSREYAMKWEAKTIARLLKQIVARSAAKHEAALASA
ncbi:MAG: hypothetical protein AAGG51_11210 [Cyanobacteria bacterium P01_G01_bin.54]